MLKVDQPTGCTCRRLIIKVYPPPFLADNKIVEGQSCHDILSQINSFPSFLTVQNQQVAPCMTLWNIKSEIKLPEMNSSLETLTFWGPARRVLKSFFNQSLRPNFIYD